MTPPHRRIALLVAATSALLALAGAPALATEPDEPAESRTTATSIVEDPPATEPVAAPPGDGSTLSYQLTSSTYTIDPGLHAKTINAACANGWYVRPAQAGAFNTWTDFNVALETNKSSTWIKLEDWGTSGVYPGGRVFSSFYMKYTNESAISKHSVSFTWWCDKVPDWYGSGSGDAVSQIGPINPGCYYCSFNYQLTNLGTGLALDPSTATAGGPVTVTTATGGADQDWYLQGSSGGNDFIDNLATFGLWREQTVLGNAMYEDPTSHELSWVGASSGEAPNYGRFFFVDDGAGLDQGAIWLVNTQTGYCLSAGGDAGSQAVGAPCDATDKTQWWVLGKAV